MYAVLGATGHTGSVVARELLSKGHPVRAVVRDATKARSLHERGAEIAVADVTNTDQLVAALRGVQAAYVMLPPCTGADDLLAAARAATDSIAAALRMSEVAHVVLLSSIGAHRDGGTGPIGSNRYAEQALFPVAPALSVLRAPYFMENWAESLSALDAGILPTMIAPEQRIPTIATEDIGRIAATALLEGARGREVWELEGPRSYSAQDVADALSRMLAHTITALFVPNQDIVPTLTGLGLAAPTAETFREMYEGIARDWIVHEGGAARVVRGRVPLEEVLQGLLESVPRAAS